MPQMINAIKLIVLNCILLIIIATGLEVAARFAYPEFQGHVHSQEQTMGIRHHTANLNGLPIRAPYPGYEHDQTKPLLVVLGDSVSNGYGAAFEDIYWVKLQRLLDIANQSTVHAVSLSGYGNNLSNSVAAIRRLASSGASHIKGILYQFNQNDVTPYGREQLQQIEGDGIVHDSLFKRFAAWRYEYLNRSVFIRVVSHYAGVLARRSTGTCEERGLDALGPYTWSFGSRMYKAESEKTWKEFAEKLSELKELAGQLSVPLWIFVSPLLFDVDKQGVHPYYNSTRMDFSCATSDPRERLGVIAKGLGIPVMDPAAYLRSSFERRLKENNFTPYFFTADENHFTPVAATYVAEYLFAELSHANTLNH
jgi:hypothetical protein